MLSQIGWLEHDVNHEGILTKPFLVQVSPNTQQRAVPRFHSEEKKKTGWEKCITMTGDTYNTQCIIIISRHLIKAPTKKYIEDCIHPCLT